MGLAAIGHGAQMHDLRAPRISARGNRVAIDHGVAREWYAAGPLGIEQGYTVVRRPAGGRGQLGLALRVDGARGAGSGSSVRFLTPAGRVWLRIGGLVAIDRAGRRLPARLQLRGRRLMVSVDDRRAQYPIRIDPLIQQGGKLTANDEDTSGVFGSSVALSADGNTALIGGPGDGVNDVGSLGAAWVFTRSPAGVWSQQGAKLTPTDEDGNGQFGSSVALSADGNTALIGAPADTGGPSDGAVGASWVFTRVGGSWVQRGSKLVAGDEMGFGQFGASVALSADGNVALIGGPFDSSTIGAAWVFKQSSGVWKQQGPKRTANDEVAGAQFGDSVALSADGTTALVGGEFDGEGLDAPGAAWVFTPGPNGLLTQQGPKLTPNDHQGFAQFGASVALSGDGNTALIGGPADHGPDGLPFVGAAWTFTRSAGVWTQRGAKLTATGEDGLASFGASVSLSSDGATALIGSPHDGGLGGAYVFTGPPGAMTQQAPKLTPTGEVGGAVAGLAVALASDGATGLLGGPFDNARVGAVWVFTPAAPTCANVSSRTAAGGAPTSVRLSCTGAPGAALRYSAVTAPGHGSIGAIDNASGTVGYTSPTGFNGQDSFTYKATDQWGNSSNVATATITVPPATPSCTDATAATAPGGGQVTVTLTCTAPPGIALTYAVLAGPSHGSVSAINQTNGQLSYFPQGGFVGSDTFTYQAVDSGGASQPATARVTVPPPPPRPITSIIGPVRVTVGSPVKYSASVIDTVGTPSAYRWTFAGRQIGAAPTLSHVFKRPGTHGLVLRVGDSAGNVINATLNVTATSPRLRVKVDLHAVFSIPPRDTTFSSLIARAVPIGTSIRFTCGGAGCPFATERVKVTEKTTCRRKRCQKPSTSPPNSRDVDLTSPVNGVRLPIGTVLTFVFTKPLTIGELETLTIGPAGPTSSKGCIPVGKTRLARRC
jgi:hypothetical protein